MTLQKFKDKMNHVSTLKTKEDMKELFGQYDLTFNEKANLAELKATFISHITDLFTKAQAHDEIKASMSDKAQLQTQAEQIIKSATELDEKLATLTQEERDAYVDHLNESMGLGEYFEKAFPQFRSAKETRSAIVVADDLPASKIITNLPVRVITQAIYSEIATYPMGHLITTEQIRNGIKDVFYNDFNDADNKSGFSDVVIGDYNPASAPVFKDTYQVDTEIHAEYPILDSVLNDVALTPAFFVELINNYVWNIAKPIAKAIYKRFIAFIDTDANYDFTKALGSADIKENSKELYEKLASLNTTGRDHLKATFGGKKLEFRLPTGDATLILNSKFSSKYKYDLVAGTFQYGEIKLQAKEILVFDFAILKGYAPDPSTSTLEDTEVVIYQDGVYQEMIHYDASKQVETPKLKSVFHRYMRIGNFKRKNRFMGKFTKNV